jgi:predicted enzyme related to lactoylglutathione lyase
MDEGHAQAERSRATVTLEQEAKMILGLRTAIYPTQDLAKGKAWYSQVLGCDPYFDEPFYVGFWVGGFELGLIPDGEPGTGGVQVYWGVPDAAAELVRLEGLGAQVHEPVKDVGGGIKVASVRDPFGNLFSIIENPHFKRDEVR